MFFLHYTIAVTSKKGVIEIGVSICTAARSAATRQSAAFFLARLTRVSAALAKGVARLVGPPASAVQPIRQLSFQGCHPIGVGLQSVVTAHWRPVWL